MTARDSAGFAAAAVPGGIASAGPFATFVGFLARFARAFAPGFVGATEHALGDAAAHARTAVIIRLAALFLAEAAARALAATVFSAQA